MKKITLTLSLIFVSLLAFSQPILINDADWDTLNRYDCAANPGPAANFFDTGNAGANYGNNENEEITVCPDFGNGSNKLSVSFGINTGLAFGIQESDTIFVYDGPNTTFPLLGAHNSSTDPNGFSHQSTFYPNATGCLTFLFKSDGANDSTGWDANIACVQLFQPFTAHMIGQMGGVGPDVISPSDTGYIDICLGDSILFTANGDFPFDSTITGNGYSQDSSNVTYEWNFSDGSTSTTKSTWFVAPGRNGYIVELKITDALGQIQTIFSKVRVSTIPSFAGVINNRDSICIGDTTVIIGGVTNTDTAGVDPTSANFQLGGSVAGQVYLPDGSGINHNDSINISGFPSGQLVTAASDIESFFLNIEHSYLGDLELMLTCPSGVEVNIFNSYSGSAGELFPGGFGGGSTYLGNAYDQNIGNPGVGFDYFFSDVNATFGTMATEFGNNNTIAVSGFGTPPVSGNSMNPNGIYLPETSFANFIGCPLNGDWKITVRDNLSTDDGYIFEWGIFFDPSINPVNETYVPTILSHQWLSAATILAGNPSDTFIVVSSNTGGTYDYTFEVTDDFGCIYDTTVQVHFLPTPIIPSDTSICDSLFNITGADAFSGGMWSFTGPGNLDFSPNISTLNPQIEASVYGVYDLTLTDNQCGIDTSFQVEFIPLPSIQGDTFSCTNQYNILGTTSYNGGVWSYTGPGNIVFSPSDSVENPLITVDQLGAYTLTFTDNQCAIVNSFQVEFIPTPPVPANDSICGTQFLVTGTTTPSNVGAWTYQTVPAGGSGIATFTGTDPLNPEINVTELGIYEFTFTESVCNKDSSFQIAFIPEPTVQNDTVICADEYQIIETSSFSGGSWSASGPGIASFSPNNTALNPLVSVTVQGQYTLTYTDSKCSVSKSFVVDFVPAPVIPTDVTQCGLAYQITGSSSFAGGVWTATGPGTVSFGPDNTSQNPTISASSYGKYNITFTDNQCGVDTSFKVYFPSNVSVNLSNADICLGEEVVLDASSSVAEATYIWSTGSTSPSIIVTDSNVYEVIVTGLCNADTANALVSTRVCNIDAPNVITPNGDNNNDVLFFEGLQHFPGSKLVVFNRWGNKVYESNNYLNNWQPKDLSAGTYFYILTPGGTVDVDVINSSFTLFND